MLLRTKKGERQVQLSIIVSKTQLLKIYWDNAEKVKQILGKFEELEALGVEIQSPGHGVTEIDVEPLTVEQVREALWKYSEMREVLEV